MKLNYKVFGQGKPLIILHGLFGSLDNWQTMARKMSEEDCLVYIVDQRNHGHSPHHDDMNYGLMADDLHELMMDNGITSANMIGHSMGGKTVMQFALDYPDMVDKLVVADMAPVEFDGGHQEIFKALFEVDLDSINSRKEAEDVLARRIPEFSVRQFLMKGLYRGKERNFEWRFNLPVIYEHYQDILAPIDSEDEFEGDTLFLKGNFSNYVRPEHKPILDRYFPNHTIQGIDAGHWLHAEKPEEFLQAVKQFLH